MLNQNLIKQIQKVFRIKPQILAIYCFGSFTKESSGNESDFDLAFVVKNRKLVKIDKIYDLIRSLSFPRDLDISIVDKTSSPLFLYEIIARGIRIYAENEAEAELLEAYVLKNYYDNAHIRNIYYQYLKNKFPIKNYVIK